MFHSHLAFIWQAETIIYFSRIIINIFKVPGAILVCVVDDSLGYLKVFTLLTYSLLTGAKLLKRFKPGYYLEHGKVLRIKLGQRIV